MGGRTSFPIVQLPKERIVIVTGANSGTGYCIAKWIAMMGATVILACRSEEKAREAMSRMNAEFRKEKTKGTQGLLGDDELRLEFMQLDLNSLKSVVDFAEAFKQSGRQLHVLFCNAGMAFGPLVKTEDGFERVMQVNYLSQFLLVCKLLPIMKRSGSDCRILFMSSVAHKWATFDINMINYDGPPSGYAPMDFYGRSKLYQIMQMYSMHRRLQGSNISVNSIHPGGVKTNIGSESNTFVSRLLVSVLRTGGQSPEEATRCSINCATNPDLAGVSGVYFDDFKHATPNATARDENKQEILWKKSFEFIKQFVTEDEIATMEGK